jgi:transposase
MILLAKSEIHTIDLQYEPENRVCQRANSCETDFASTLHDRRSLPRGIMELQPFGTMTRDLLAFWLAEVDVTHVAMESTGEYWRRVYNLLEGNVTIFLVNAAHVKQVPG